MSQTRGILDKQGYTHALSLTQDNYVILVFHGNFYAKAPQCYVMPTLPVLCNLYFIATG